MMNTPVLDFVQKYAASEMIRFHMPGHKGRSVLGMEKWDITEVKGADALYEAEGIIAESEANAAALFGSERTLYSTEGSSQCIRAMLYLACQNCRTGNRPVVVAARNVHKAFVSAAVLLDLEVVWLWPEETDSLCGCPVSAKQLENVLSDLETPPAAVYLTSPDYLGGMADISVMAEVCHKYGTLLLVDNAHGAYLRFLQPSLHPLDLGADLCCDSAHKTLPVLTGGAYLHISKNVSEEISASSKLAMSLFGSTSPSYLTLESLDACNRELAEGFEEKLQNMIQEITRLKMQLTEAGWYVENSDPLRLTLRMPCGINGTGLAQKLRDAGIECEYADDMFLVLMLTACNEAEEFAYLQNVLGENKAPRTPSKSLSSARGKQVYSIRQAMFVPHEMIPVSEALGRICGAPTVSCPPAIPIVISGEQITEEAIALFHKYGIQNVDVMKE